MRGEFDNQLKWPFRGSVTFKLITQEEDSDHVTDTAYSQYVPLKCKRVISEGQLRDNAWGISTFLPHAELQPNYLKNDCIKIYVKRVELY